MKTMSNCNESAFYLDMKRRFIEFQAFGESQFTFVSRERAELVWSELAPCIRKHLERDGVNLNN